MMSRTRVNTAASDMSLDHDSICSTLQSNHIAWRLDLQEEITSSSDIAKEAGLHGAESGLVVCAELQTAGRGQRSNRWLTPKGNDLMFSLLLRPALLLDFWPRLTTLAAVAVCRAIEHTLPLQAGIKWPNDIHIGGRKVSGLLAETTISRSGMFVVLGIGINVNTTDFPEELRDIATSLKLAIGTSNLPVLPREPVLAAFLNELDELMHSSWEEGFTDLLMEVRQRNVLLGKNIRALVDGQPVTGRVRDLNHEGHLVLERLDGSTETLTSAAEVRVTM